MYVPGIHQLVFAVWLPHEWKNGDILGSMQKIGMFIVTDTIGSFIHTLVFLPIVYFAFTRKNPYAF